VWKHLASDVKIANLIATVIQTALRDARSQRAKIDKINGQSIRRI